jgi:RNA polymerase sigma factor (TIGR02999 family)
MAVASRLMRRVLIDFARSRGYQKRGGDVQRVVFDESLVVDVGRGHDLLALDEALDALARVDSRKSQIVVMRFFGGLSVEEVATVLNLSAATVTRDWKLAKSWLLRELDRTTTEQGQ